MKKNCIIIKKKKATTQRSFHL